MKILSAEFIRSCVKPEDFPREQLYEVAFVGRSNVGKSSTINSLLNRKRIAKVSTTPGKTQTLNFFRVTMDEDLLKKIYFVDLPGYGYAKAPRSVRKQWKPMVEQYFSERSQLFAVVYLVDSRVNEEQDAMTLEWLTHIGHRPIIVVTKIDKLAHGQRRSALIKIGEQLELSAMEELIAYSSRTREGRQMLWSAIQNRFKSFYAQNYELSYKG